MEKYGIKKSTYYEKAKNIRQMRLEATEKHTQTIVEQGLDSQSLIKLKL